jgi:hypothetical protein
MGGGGKFCSLPGVRETVGLVDGAALGYSRGEAVGGGGEFCSLPEETVGLVEGAALGDGTLSFVISAVDV